MNSLKDVPNPSSAANPGFTLIELLITISIISILAAMLLTSLARAKAQANSASCKNHLRQLGLALKMYLDDNSAKYPYLTYWTNDSLASGVEWVEVLGIYYPIRWTNSAYHCPGYKLPITVPSSPSGWEYCGSYGYNAFGSYSLEKSTKFAVSTLGLGSLWDATHPAFSPACASESQVEAPSEMFAIADSREHWAFTSGKFVRACDDYIHCTSGGTNWSQPSRHGKNYNVVCCDGHVEPIKAAAFFSPSNTASRWNKDHLPHQETW